MEPSKILSRDAQVICNQIAQMGANLMQQIGDATLSFQTVILSLERFEKRQCSHNECKIMRSFSIFQVEICDRWNSTAAGELCVAMSYNGLLWACC